MYHKNKHICLEKSVCHSVISEFYIETMGRGGRYLEHHIFVKMENAVTTQESASILCLSEFLIWMGDARVTEHWIGSGRISSCPSVSRFCALCYIYIR